jgi:hypothetical protein
MVCSVRMPIKPLQANHGNQILELFCVSRDKDDETVEIAESSDGAMKLYASRGQAEAARDILGEGWTVETIWLLHKGFSDITPQAAALAETGMFSEQAVRSIDTLVKKMERRK